MRSNLRDHRPSHGTAVAYLALFVALGGGAYAASSLPNNSVGTKQLKNNAVVSSKIHNGDVKHADIGAGAVTDSKVGRNALTGRVIRESTLGRVPDAAKLGGVPAASFQQICNPGSIAAHVYVKGSSNTTTWPALTYVTGPLQDSFNCTGGTPPAQVKRTAIGTYLVDFPGVDPATHLVASGNVTVDPASNQVPNDVLTYKLVFDTGGLNRTVYRVEISNANTNVLQDAEFSFSVNG